MRKIYQTNINKLSKFMNIITLKSAENIPTYLRFLTLKDDWCCYESAGKNQTAAALAPCSRHYTETFERLFWNILTKNSCRVITSAHRSIPFFSLQVITFAHGFLLCFKSDSVGATTKLLYFMQIKALKNWRCKSSVISATSMKLHTALFASPCSRLV